MYIKLITAFAITRSIIALVLLFALIYFIIKVLPNAIIFVNHLLAPSN